MCTLKQLPMAEEKKKPEELQDEQLDDVTGGGSNMFAPREQTTML